MSLAKPPFPSRVENHRIRVIHTTAADAKPGDLLTVAGLAYQVLSVGKGGGGVNIEALRADDTGSLTLRLHDDADYAAIRWAD